MYFPWTHALIPKLLPSLTFIRREKRVKREAADLIWDLKGQSTKYKDIYKSAVREWGWFVVVCEWFCGQRRIFWHWNVMWHQHHLIKMESVSGPAEGSVSLVNKHIKATHSYEQHCPSTTINTKNCHTIMAFWCFTMVFFE